MITLLIGVAVLWVLWRAPIRFTVEWWIAFAFTGTLTVIQLVACARKLH